MIRLWIGYQALRFALWVMPKETGAVFEYVINDMMDMADDESRRPEIAELVRKARARASTGACWVWSSEQRTQS